MHSDEDKLRKGNNNGNFSGNQHVVRQSNKQEGVEGYRSYANAVRHEGFLRQREGGTKQ
ncbi:hypothetical protein A2U01_0079104, partial [Trifolium medium]|nr:hypothetical protein [Trifolium medium]